MWYSFLILHLVGLVGYNLVLRRSLSRRADPWVQAALMQTGIALPIIIVSWFVPLHLGAMTDEVGFLLCLALSLTIALHITNTLSLQRLEAGVHSVLYNVRLLFVTILGVILLGEYVSFLQIVGGGLIFMAAFIIRQRGSHKTTRAGVAWAVSCAMTIACLNIVEKKLVTSVGYVTYMTLMAYIATPLLWGIVLVLKRPIDRQLFCQKKTYLLMTFRALSAHCFVLALSAGLVSITSFISGPGVIIIMILGALLLGERDHPRQKILATMLATLGLACIVWR